MEEYKAAKICFKEEKMVDRLVLLWLPSLALVGAAAAAAARGNMVSRFIIQEDSMDHAKSCFTFTFSSSKNNDHL